MLIWVLAFSECLSTISAEKGCGFYAMIRETTSISVRTPCLKPSTGTRSSTRCTKVLNGVSGPKFTGANPTQVAPSEAHALASVKPQTKFGTITKAGSSFLRTARIMSKIGSFGFPSTGGMDRMTSISKSGPMIFFTSRIRSSGVCPGSVLPSTSITADPGTALMMEPARMIVGLAVLW